MTLVIGTLAIVFWTVLFGSSVHLVLFSSYDPDVRLGGVLMVLLLLLVAALGIAGLG